MKQVMIVNGALEMPAGKLSAQVAHASVSAFLISPMELQQVWLDEGMPKIVLKGASEAGLEDLQTRALEAGLPAYLIHDAGRTVLAEGTTTCLGIGPAPDDEINKVTGSLPLL